MDNFAIKFQSINDNRIYRLIEIYCMISTKLIEFQIKTFHAFFELLKIDSSLSV
jgi:hypothetical protein